MSSRRLIKIHCNYCGKVFFREFRWVKYNQKCQLNNFCSKFCGFKFKKTGELLTCENGNCNKIFYKPKRFISSHNYCSRSCAVAVNNSKAPKRKAKIKKCKLCGYPFKASKGLSYCSVRCYFLTRSTYTKDDLIQTIRKTSEKLGRIPAKREVTRLAERSIHLFGSWNKAILAAGFEPNRSHNHRMYRQTKTKAVDGHICDSVSEALVDNWLTQNKISHTRNYSYPNSRHKADWALLDGKIFIEYFGLAKDSPRYDRNIKKKKILCNKAGIKLVGIYPEDLYPSKNLDAKLTFLNRDLST